MELAVIYLNDQIANIYVNTGYYAEKVCNEMKESTNQFGSTVELVRYHVDCTNDELNEFIKKHTVKINSKS